MSTIWLNPQYARIRDYGATVKGPKAIVRVEIEVSEPGALGFLLEELAQAKNELAAARQTPSKKAASRSEPPAIEREAMLSLPYYGGAK
ncbi:hypothetical protein NKH36_16455 [Mesorhizobium sp. M1312]|uniref:hypothetical protein n=1 Tax=unclassified Mesorhizobium TaxID=325217 RepID=UPI000FD20020|nr:hypothetical protein [Mesorhizobium sp.]RUU46482.1 hypothetical protein EOD08_08265 [Mesorhizobium sp. M6A.T.Ca.TU.002.02.2.1]RWO97185.1 MAG: hypothetical protein EOQ98_19320 [Mesorhizobium sp.]TIM52597.1 MAG: hypothetical protein E5Y69_00825 [Mesorhizobium sp.]